jgi:diguanylate cyclase (GGDEF)-like protein
VTAIGIVAACVVLAACGLAVYALRRSRQDAERRLEVVLAQLASHLDAISAGVEDSVARVVAAQRDRLQPLTLDFDELVEGIVAEAAARTGADAVVLRIEGPGGRPVVASSGPGVRDDLVARTFTDPDTQAFRAATIDWTYSPAGEPDDQRFHSALVAPLGATAGIPGTLVAYSTAPSAFGAEHTTVLQELLAEIATGLANARRFADVEARLLLDPETGVANRRGYELELGREIARASRTGRPLSVVLVGIEYGGETSTTAGKTNGVDQFARLLTRVTRRSDISCRRSDRQFAILLPETRAPGAAVLTNRLREEAKRSLGAGRATIAVGHVEWQPDESIEALDARVDAALSPASAKSVLAPVVVPTARATTVDVPAIEAEAGEAAAALRNDVLDAVAQEILEARPVGRSLAVAAIGVDGLDEIAEQDRESADAALARVVKRLTDSVGSGSVHRLATREFLLVLRDASADDAEALLGSLHVSTGAEEAAGITLSAGITELVERDGAQTALARAEHALWQARQTGRGTVVVAVPGRRAPRFE